MESIEMTLGYKVLMLFENIQEASKKDFRALGITQTNYAIMYYISKYPGISQQELADATFKDVNIVEKGIDKLIERGYARRLRGKLDRTSFSLYLTEKGEMIVLEYRAALDKGEDVFLQKLSPEEQETFMKLLDKMLG